MTPLALYIELAKPRIASLVGLTTLLGWWLAGGSASAGLAWTLAGTVLAAGGCGALNQWLERDVDALMRRTRARPLPSGRLAPRRALLFGLALSAAGLGALAWNAAGAPLALTAATLGLYVLVYTPLKRVTPHSTWVGAAAGATPPLVGWTAAGGEPGLAAFALFAIQFLWQIPHFLAMFWLHREDYARAGLRVMPALDASGAVTACQISLHCFALLLASILPVLAGIAGPSYGLAALAMGAAFLALGMRASWTLSTADARRLFLASLVYLPALFGMLALGA